MVKPYQVLRRLGAALDWRWHYLVEGVTVGWRRFVARIRWRFDSRPGLLTLNGVRLRIGPHLSPYVLYCIRRGEYETREAELVRRLLRPDDRVLELGAGLGFLTSLCALIVGSDRVMAYEANPTLEAHIHETFVLNNVSPALHMVMADTGEGAATLHVTEDFWTASRIPRPSTASRAIAVPTRNVNSDIAVFRPTVLIVDIEGGERDLIPRLRLEGIRALIVEVHQSVIGLDGVEQMRRSLSERGFGLDESLHGVELFRHLE